MNGSSKICGRQPLKNLKGYGLFKQKNPFRFLKGCLPQTLLSPLLNTVSSDHQSTLVEIFDILNEITSHQQCTNSWLTEVY